MRSRPSRSLAVGRDPRSGRQIFRKALFLALVDLGQTGRRLSPHIFSQLWVWVFRCLEGVHREVALQRPLFAAPQGYLRSQSANAYLVGEHSHHPCPPLHLLEQALRHVRRAYPGVVASWIAQVAQGIIDPSLKHRNRPRKTLPVDLYELPGQSPSTLLAPYLEDRLQIVGYLFHRGGWHVRENVALEVHHPNAIGELRATVVIPFVSTAKTYTTRRRRRRAT